MEARLAGHGRLLRLLDVELGRGGRLLVFDVALKDAPAAPGDERRRVGPRAHPHDPWALESALQRVGAPGHGPPRATGRGAAPPPVILYDNDLSQDDDFTVRGLLPRRARLPRAAGVTCKELPAARVAFTTFHGPYDTIWNAYVELQAWVVEHGYKAAGPLRETGLVTDDDDVDPRDWVTELSVPVAPRWRLLDLPPRETCILSPVHQLNGGTSHEVSNMDWGAARAACGSAHRPGGGGRGQQAGGHRVHERLRVHGEPG